MIFTSLGIFIASLCFLIAGIVRSSIPLLVVSLIATVGSIIVLLATADLARRRAWESAGLPVVAGGPPGTQPVVMYVPTTEAAPVTAAPAGNGAANADASPFLGYDDMSAAQVTKLVSSGALTVEQLVAVRRYEMDNAARKSVLERVDRAIRS